MEVNEVVKLDLGCGETKKEGFTGVDTKSTPSVDVVYDLFKLPWPWQDDSVDEVNCSYFYHLVPQELRGKFMEELYRILKKGGKASFTVPHVSSWRGTFDYRTQYPPIVEQSFVVFDKEWRTKTKHDDDLKCDFSVVVAYLMSNPRWVSSNDETKGFAVNHYRNVVDDIQATLIKK